ncbi:hypothetical protein ACFLTT_03245 [Chloroflexota bacterium]
MSQVEPEKLKMLIAHWIEHNSEHASEFRELAETVKGQEALDVSSELSQAAQGIDQANDWLNKALEKVK